MRGANHAGRERIEELQYAAVSELGDEKVVVAVDRNPKRLIEVLRFAQPQVGRRDHEIGALACQRRSRESRKWTRILGDAVVQSIRHIKIAVRVGRDTLRTVERGEGRNAPALVWIDVQEVDLPDNHVGWRVVGKSGRAVPSEYAVIAQVGHIEVAGGVDRDLRR